MLWYDFRKHDLTVTILLRLFNKLSKLSKIRQPSSLDKTGKTTLTNSSRIFANGYTSRVAAIIYAPTVLNKKKNSKYGMEEHMA